MGERIEIGRGWITENLVFVGPVAAGGAVGPGNVYMQTDFDSHTSVRYFRDDRSGSKRSGSCAWQLEPNRVYRLSDVAYSSRQGATFFVSTYNDQATELSRDEFDAERARIWPMGKQLADEAAERRRVQEEERMRRDAELAEQRRIEQEALAELNAEKAAEIEKNGQPESDLPVLKGSPKQIAYALTIREAYAKKHPGDATLKRGKTAKYWIENHRSVLYR
jgi:hypothetical protein